MHRRYVNLLSHLFALFSLLNLMVILTIEYLESNRPDLMVQIFVLLGIIAFTFVIISFIYKIILIIFFFEKVDQNTLLTMRALYSELLVWLSTGIIVIILLKVYQFF